MKPINLLNAIVLASSIPLLALFTYLTFVDWRLLDDATNHILKYHQSMTTKELGYYTSRELAHRINLLAEGTWLLMSVGLGLYAANQLVKRG